ncbi:MAG TPA: zf-HC2 domain-containing protein [Thermoanaerobaculia bacterium]|nr:zf-HC2 domain-containing protein [Thermoanaerobaculia bacterium]
MLCRDIQRVVYFFLDGALGENKKQDYSNHLSLCPDCQARTKFHSRIRAFVQSRLARITAPDRLKMRLTRSIRAFRAEWSR